MNSGRATLDVVIAVEAAAALVLVVLVLAFLPLLREGEPEPAQAKPAPRIEAGRMAEPSAAANPAVPPPDAASLSRLRSRRLSRGRRAAVVDSSGISSIGATVKVEPRREIRSKLPRPSPPAGAAKAGSLPI